jgi:two-component system CheB/CheR fusion protein
MESFAHSSWKKVDRQSFSEHLLARSQQYAAIFVNDDGLIDGWSEGAHHLTGYTADEAIGQNFSLIFTQEDREKKIDRHELKTAIAVGFCEDERWHLRKDGSKLWASGFTMRVESDKLVKLFRDSTHLRTRSTALENEISDKNLQQFAAAQTFAQVAHDLRNPLAPIKYSTKILRSTDKPELRERALDTIERALSSLEHLIGDLVDATRVTFGKLSLDFKRVELFAFVHHLVEQFEGQAMEQKVELTCLVPDEPLEVDIDPERLEQVLTNLITNALKFTPAGGRVRVDATFDHSHFLLTVKDTGIGIGPEMQPRIFELFTQAKTAVEKKGLGIGLAIVKEIVSLHQGTVEVRSEGQGKGSEFLVRLPLRHDAPLVFPEPQ